MKLNEPGLNADWRMRNDVFSHISSDHLDEAISVIKGLGVGHETYPRNEVVEFLDRVAKAAVTIRDAGHHENALKLLKAAVSIDPVYLPLHKELLVILILNQNKMPEALTHISSNPAVQGEPWIMFWETECYRRLGDFSKMTEAYTKLMPNAIWFFPFEVIWADIGFDAARYTVNLLQRLSTGWSDGPWDIKRFTAIPTPLMVGFLDPFGKSPAVFERQLKRCLETEISGFNLHNSAIQFVLEHLDSLDSVQQVIFFHTIVSFCKDDAVRLFLSNPKRLAILSHFPGFIKNLDLFMQRTGLYATQFESCLAAFLRSKAVEQFIEGDQSAFGFAESNVAVTCAVEVLSRHRERIPSAKRDKLKFLPQARRTARGTTVKKHLFVGMFGQMRAPNEALKPQLEYLHRDLEQWRDDGHLVSFGVATWKETGAKVIEMSNRHFEYVHRLPKELSELIAADEIGNFSEFVNKFPATGRKVFALSRQLVEIDSGFISRKFLESGFKADELFIDLSSEAQFMRDLGSRMQDAFGNYTLVLNQGRMFHRIAAFRELAEQAQRKTEHPVTNFALIRPDVIFNTGSITEVVRRTAEPAEDRTVYCDLDSGAQYVDGMGDRYFVGAAKPVSRLFETAQIISEMLGETFWQTYKHRIKWHTLPRTILYESDCIVKPIPPGPGFFFHRARCELADIAAEILIDTADATDEMALRMRRMAGAV